MDKNITKGAKFDYRFSNDFMSERVVNCEIVDVRKTLAGEEFVTFKIVWEMHSVIGRHKRSTEYTVPIKEFRENALVPTTLTDK